MLVPVDEDPGLFVAPAGAGGPAEPTSFPEVRFDVGAGGGAGAPFAGGAPSSTQPVVADAGASASETPGASDAGPRVPPADAGGLDAGGADAGEGVSGQGDAGGVGPLPTDAGPAAGGPVSAHTALGLPDDSAVGRLDRWLLVKPQFVSSYDTTRKTPRWVAWRLDASWLGTATRATSFRRDAQLPATAGQARDEDFRNSGFDRGHLCPSADRTRTDPDNDATFVFTNVVPQTRASNAGTWATLEDDARGFVQQGKSVMLVAGPVFGVTTQNVGSGVPVPLSTFKVAVVFDGPQVGAGAVTTSTRVIGVVVPNTASVSGDWRSHRVSVRAIEQLTGLDFLADVPRAVQDVVETRVDALP